MGLLKRNVAGLGNHAPIGIDLSATMQNYLIIFGRAF